MAASEDRLVDSPTGTELGPAAIVGFEPSGKGGEPRLVRPVQTCVRPLVQERAVEPFDLAVGLWPVRPGGEVAGADRGQRRLEVLGQDVVPGLVSHHALDPDAELLEVCGARSRNRAQVGPRSSAWTST